MQFSFSSKEVDFLTYVIYDITTKADHTGDKDVSEYGESLVSKLNPEPGMTNLKPRDIKELRILMQSLLDLQQNLSQEEPSEEEIKNMLDAVKTTEIIIEKLNREVP